MIDAKKIAAAHDMHQCPACEKAIPRKMSFCFICWKLLPKEIQDAINSAKASGMLPRIRQAINAGIEWSKDRKAGVQAK